MPMTDGRGRRASRLGSFANIVYASAFDEARAVLTVSHRLAPQAFNKGADVFNAPRGSPRSDLNRLGIAPIAHALPPSGFPDGDDGRDWGNASLVADYLLQTKITDFG